MKMVKFYKFYCLHCGKKLLYEGVDNIIEKFDSNHSSKSWLCKNCNRKMYYFLHNDMED